MNRGVLIAVIFAVLAAVACGGWYFSQSRPDNPSNLVISDSETRTFKHTTLGNGLSVVMVSDPEAEKAAAAMNVFSGSWSDPRDTQGLAHFVEHMLFLGTEKYPEIDAYQQYIEQNGGSYNAYTAAENTMYFFDISAEAFEGGLDRLSQFFIAPLFDADFTQREMNAVHSEYTASLQTDSRRVQDVIREISNPQHPQSKLAIGTAETLNVPDISIQLLNFYREHYVADNMTLVIYGPQSIEALESWAKQYFAGVRDLPASAKPAHAPMFESVELPMLIEVEPRQELRSLQLRFPISNTAAQWLDKPYNFIGLILGDESEGSLFSLLKSRGWVEGLYAGAGRLTYAETTFNVSIQLTPAGYENWSQIVELVFANIALIRERGVEPWVYEEQLNLSRMAFENAEKVSPTSMAIRLAERARYYPIDRLVSAPFELPEYTDGFIAESLEALKPDNALVVLISPDSETDKRSEFYDTPYRVSALSGNQVASWRTPEQVSGLSYLSPNPFVAEDLTVAPLAQEASSLYSNNPQIIFDDELKTVWFEQDDEFQTPRTDIHLLIRTDFSSQSARNAMALNLYLRLVNDALSEIRYKASQADLDYRVYSSSDGPQIRLYGYQDKLQLLFDALVIELVDHEIDAQRFALLREELLRDLRNSREAPVLNQTMQELSQWLLSNRFSIAERIDATNSLTLDFLVEARNEWLTNSHLEFLIHGNLYEEDAIAISERIDNVIPQQGGSFSDRQLAMLPEKQFIDQVSIDHSDSAMLHYFQGQDSSLRERALFTLLADILKSPYFTELRTKEQLGYTVLTRTYVLDGLPGMMLYVQSPVVDSALLQLYSNRFLSRFSYELDDMTENTFNDFKQGIITNLTAQDKNLYELSERYWSNIRSGNPHFNTLQRIAHEVERISLDGFRRFYSNQIIGLETRALLLHQIGTGMQSTYQETAENLVGYYPLTEPKDWTEDVTWQTPTFNNL